MSYYISIVDRETGEVLEAKTPHQIRGGTYAVGGTRDLSINVTYNYSRHFHKAFDDPEGIRCLYHHRVIDTLPMIAEAIHSLGTDVTDDYWEPTEGNARAALVSLFQLGCIAAQEHSDAVWSGD